MSSVDGRRRPRAAFFDAGNTLLRMDYAAIARAVRRHGLRVRAAALERAEWRARVRLDDEVLAATAVSTESGATGDRYLQLLLEEIGVTDAQIVQAVEAWRRDYNPPVGVWGRADPRAAAALTAAREAGLVVGVISNSNGSARGILESVGLAAHVHFVIDSFEEGVEKPDPRIFGIALERAGVRAIEAVYVGDLYSVDVLGARGAGIDAVLLDPGRHWGIRDCRTAPNVLAAVRLLLSD